MATKEELQELVNEIKSYLEKRSDLEHQKTISAFKEHCFQRSNHVTTRLAEGATKFSEINKDLENFKIWQKKQNGCLDDIKQEIKEMRKDISDMKQEYLHGRPSWFVLVLISIAVGIIGAFFGGLL